MSFMYYYPGKGAIPDELAYVLKQEDAHHRRHVLRGPLGRGEGTIVADESVVGELVRFDEHSQLWKPFPGESQLCVGLPNGVKPSPEALLRSKHLRGHWVTLADGSRWLVPIARGFDIDTEQIYVAIPLALEYQCSTGRWIAGGVESQYKAFFDLATMHAQRRWEHLEKGILFYHDPDGDTLAITALQTNYRISGVELSFFNDAYTPLTRQEILNAVIDQPTWMEWVNKKKERESVGTST